MCHLRPLPSIIATSGCKAFRLAYARAFLFSLPFESLSLIPSSSHEYPLDPRRSQERNINLFERAPVELLRPVSGILGFRQISRLLTATTFVHKFKRFNNTIERAAAIGALRSAGSSYIKIITSHRPTGE